MIDPLPDDAFWIRPHSRWRYELRRDVMFIVPPSSWEIEVWAGQRRIAELSPGGFLTVFPGYAWDGATCAPDARRLLRATLAHDILCQCAGIFPWPISRAQADRVFLTVATEDAGPVLARTYYAGIRLFGGLHAALTAGTRKKMGSRQRVHFVARRARPSLEFL